ncbi:MAG TPA: tetratricopeptide repeat protein [Burkholderiales bacterium]|nr:tetratricopeptide repeat protein [Burkholderiales bacterium]
MSGALNRPDYAEHFCRKALEGHPDDVAALNNLGNVYRSGGRYDEALNGFDRAIRLAPREAALYHGRGLAYLDLRRDADALADQDGIEAG